MFSRIAAVLLASLAVVRAETLVVKNEADLAAAAERAAAITDTQPLVIRFESGTFELHDSFRILRSEVELKGGKETRLVLADGVNKPVIVVGNQDEIPLEEARIRGVRIADLEIDGNRDAQTSEVGNDHPWIRNNGIDVRMTSDLVIENVRSNRNRSGGVVISWKSRNVTVRNSRFAENFFDGVAYYDSTGVRTIDCVMRANDGAGISLDNEFASSEFIGCELVDNGDVGIFMRASEHIRFKRCAITGSGNWGAFLANDEIDRGVHDIDFERCTFTRNDGGLRMASVNEAQSSDIRVIHCKFEDNGANGRENIDSAGVAVTVKDSD